MEEEQTPKKKQRKPWIVIVVGVLLLALGGASYFQSETVNNLFVEIGANQVGTGIIEAQPNSRAVLVVSADVIDAAIEARTVSPKALTALLTKALAPYTGLVNIGPIIDAVLNQINSAYEVGVTEDKYIAKLTCVARGLRSAALSGN